MRNDDDQGQGAGSGDMLGLAARPYEQVLRELDAILGDLQGREDGAVAKAKTSATEVRKAIQTVFEERHRLDRFNDKDTGSGGGIVLDLDAARDEIGRRLACLRDRG